MAVAMVTGGSRGIGAATAMLLAARGFDVCITYLQSTNSAAAIVERIRQLGRKAIAVQADVAVEAQVVAAFQESDRRLGRLSALVNNAGILGCQQRVEEIEAQRLAKILAVNVTGSFLCAREAVKRMSTKCGGQGGAIVNVSSAAARLGAPGEYVDYAASKAALDAMTIGLSKEVASEGIRVNAVRPACIYTDIHASGGDPDRVNRIAPTLPMRRGGRPHEVAEAIAWLLSEAASYATGTFIEMAGGR